MSKATFKLWGMSGSGNCYKPALLMAQLGLPHAWEEVDAVGGATRTPEFLALNPNGRVPLLQLPDGRLLAESNAMLCYLAEGSALLPAGRYARALVMQWLFFEQYSHEPYIATVRFWIYCLGKRDEWREKIAEARVKGYAALDVMERQLQQTAFLAGEAYSIADIALYAYTHVADQGDYSLENYPAVRRWLQRVQSQPGFVVMPDVIR